MVDEKIVKRRVDRLSQQQQSHEERLTRLEKWRMEVRGALKVLALIVGSGAVAYVVDLIGMI